MKYFLIILFISINIQAQNVWYVDRDATGANTGRSWTDAWNTLDSSGWSDFNGVNWTLIGDGDTIYVSGGTDSTAYAPIGANNNHNGIRHEDVGTQTFNTQVVITPAWHPNHNGDVYFTFRNDHFGTYLFLVANVNNVKIRGMNFVDNRSNAVVSGSNLISVYGSNIHIDSCYFFSRGLVPGIGFDGEAVDCKLTNSFFETEDNALARSIDLLGATWGGRGLVITGNTFINRNRYDRLENTGAIGTVTVTDTSLMDDGLSMTTDYHVGNYIFAGGYSLPITSNSNNTFYGSSGWEFSNYTAPCFDEVTATGLSWATCGAENIIENGYIGAWAVVGSDSIQITSNSQYGLIGTGGWIPSTPTGGSQAWEIHGSGAPTNGVDWQMGGFHVDYTQISGQGSETPGTYNTTLIANNLFVNQFPEGNEWNGFFYTIGQKNSRTVFYNNIIVHEKRADVVMFWLHSYIYSSTIQTALILNNTVLMSGSGGNGGAMVTGGNHDTMIVKNNLFIYDTTKTGYVIGHVFGNLFYDYNHYAVYGGLPEQFSVYDPFRNFAQWQGIGQDVNSDSSDSEDVTFTEKWGTDITDYYTTTGRGAGINLAEEHPEIIALYPELMYDILGNPRPETGAWDIGALQFIEGGVDTIPSYSFTAVTNAELDSTYTAYSVFAGTDSTFTVYTTTVAQFKIGALDTYSAITKYAEAGDTVFIQNTSSTEYSTLTTQTLVAGGVERSFNVTTKAEPSPVPITGGWLHQSNGRKLFFNNGKAIITQDN